MRRFGSAPQHDEADQAAANEQRNDDDMLAMAVDEFIRSPDYTAVQRLILEHAGKYRPWFDGCIDAIDGTHVLCVPRRENADAWINRKGFYSQNNIGEAIAFHGFPIPPPVHNFIRMVQIGDQFLEEYVADCMPVRGNVNVNADYVFDEGEDSTGPSTRTQQHGSRTGAMNQMREMITDDMWERYQSYPWYKTT
ncbi:hypothetical protein TIFTF001_036041 [Ficus carica]|uniref:Uncharacterized protein n=1 Tax=Ficus carica TaxID=3494 RepID=A0AA88E3I8_FICCA|nr:hypothetical protein TIFTF001_036041 [Ficus carica]